MSFTNYSLSHRDELVLQAQNRNLIGSSLSYDLRSVELRKSPIPRDEENESEEKEMPSED